MAEKFEKLQFTKNWNSSADFPTYEESEQKVRADMQFLHDETKEFINETLIPSIENMAVPGTGDMLESIYDPERKRENVYAYADQKVADVTPEGIGAATSEALQSHIDNQNNPHNVTAEQLGAISTDWYMWKVYIPAVATYEVGVDMQVLNAASVSIYYSDTVVNNNGVLYLGEPVSTTPALYANNYAATIGANGLSNKFWIQGAKTGSVRYSPEGTTIEASSTASNGIKVSYYNVVAKNTAAEYIESRNSTDINAYPHNEENDGLYYEFYGNFVETLLAHGARIQTGSYVGTGTYGESNPCSLTFSFVPKVVIVIKNNAGYLPSGTIGLIWLGQDGSLGTNATKFTSDGNTLSWYSDTNANCQCNQSSEYYWVAIG